MNGNLTTVVAESEITLAPDLTIKVLLLSDGNRIIPEDDMQRACEWIGADWSSLQAMTQTTLKGG
ncbi:hypothetical protein SAMN05216516_12018 [Izhakiella capsodis]|uniref:Uncharacterized protein n=1 Tax=Izhakiella capsodis TaxID=1367852 RepID=A0A1I5BQF2_9GAMM|nr:hypothetical protein [Izhakiella capsodis]SFN76907.1 hypothetical protein SAMN05216516_12018 [Izhakiella capsodis]